MDISYTRVSGFSHLSLSELEATLKAIATVWMTSDLTISELYAHITLPRPPPAETFLPFQKSPKSHASLLLSLLGPFAHRISELKFHLYNFRSPKFYPEKTGLMHILTQWYILD